MYLLLKTIVQERSVIERFFAKPIPVEAGEVFFLCGKRLRIELQNLDTTKRQLARDLGIDSRDPEIDKKPEHKERLEQFDNEVRRLLSEEITIEHEPVPISFLRGMNIAVFDLVALSELGILKDG